MRVRETPRGIPGNSIGKRDSTTRPIKPSNSKLMPPTMRLGPFSSNEMNGENHDPLGTTQRPSMMLKGDMTYTIRNLRQWTEALPAGDTSYWETTLSSTQTTPTLPTTATRIN